MGDARTLVGRGNMRLLLRAPADPEDPPTDLSFDDVYRQHANRVALWIRRLGGPRIDADEALQDVFITISRRLPEFRGEGKLTTWLFRVTAHVVANHRRAVRRRGFWARVIGHRLDAVPSTQPTPAEALEERQAAELFYRVLDDLPEHYRQVLVLFEVEEMTTEDIARTLDRLPATVRVWLHRARAQFTKRWLHHGRQQEGTG
jgi:RNA polymerase sigma-70 factor (ECF subfamily)